ncbi:MAG TPA: ribonuclease Y [Clostridia bacterium]|nr:ribonuclease Y [Clostridia bacterium]HRX41826.1 ribonuclease Y [Clostridia bacterium]
MPNMILILSFGAALLIIIAIVSFVIGGVAARNKASKTVGDAKSQVQKIIAEGEKQAEAKRREIMIEAKEEIHKSKVALEKDLKERRSEILQMEKRILQKEENLERKLESLESKDELLTNKVKKIEEKERETNELLQRQLEKLETISGLTVEEAKNYMLSLLEDEIKHEKAVIIREHETRVKEESDQIAQTIIATAIQNNAADYVAENTVSVVALPNDEMKGRIIGREGRNIRALETMTGIDIIIDDTPEAVVLSGFDPIRREIARITLEKLIADGRIHPARIEEMVNKATKELENTVKKTGDQAAFDAGVFNLHPELITLIGRLKYRTSYGQNILKHSLEVASLAGVMAGELGLDVKLAKRAGLLHDIGKSIDFEMEGSHISIGADIAKKYKENDVVINSIMSHHGDVEPNSAISVLIQAADAISAARPGARRETLEAYVKRIEKLEEIASSFDGIEKSYAVQAGREIRIMVKPDELSDDDIVLKCREIVKKIEDELDYPGQIKVNVIRETRVTEYAK